MKYDTRFILVVTFYLQNTYILDKEWNNRLSQQIHIQSFFYIFLVISWEQVSQIIY
jgi:hypothetical protein